MCICCVLGKVLEKFAGRHIEESSGNSHAGKVRAGQFPGIFVVYKVSP